MDCFIQPIYGKFGDDGDGLNMFKSYDIPYLEGMNIHKSQLNLDVNRRASGFRPIPIYTHMGGS